MIRTKAWFGLVWFGLYKLGPYPLAKCRVNNKIILGPKHFHVFLEVLQEREKKYPRDKSNTQISNKNLLRLSKISQELIHEKFIG